MSGDTSLPAVYDAVSKIAAASRNQPGNQEEILKLLKHIPHISQSLLPFPADYHPSSMHEKDAWDLFQSLSKYLVDRLKYLVHSEDTKFRPIRSCQCLSDLVLLGGTDHAKQKFSEVVSHETYILIQNNMEYVENIPKNIEKVEKSIVSLVHQVRPLVLDMVEALFLCEVMKLTYNEQMSLISSTILEKLSTELLTVVDALKESAIKSSSKKIGNYLEAQAISCEDSISCNNLISLGRILDSFLSLEMDLRNSSIARIEELRNGFDRRKKSSLKQRLPDILRSSQEASWVRSLYRYGDWDWQEILRDIGSIIANTITKSFEEFQAKESSSIKKSSSDSESHHVDVAPSLSSEIPSASGTPKKIILYFKEALSLIKAFLPFGVIGSHYKPLLLVLSCYTDECTQILRMMKSYLSMLLDDFPEKTTPIILLLGVSTCDDVITTLSHCTLSISTEVRAPFQGSFQLYSDMQKTLQSAIVQHLCGRMRGCILHDAESNHFSDPKEFSDGERCSYALENWKRFLKRLWRDMDSSVSLSSRNDMFSNIFLDSVIALKMRYLRCEPSYNRTKQFHRDIPFIVSTCEEFLSLHYHSLNPETRLFSETDGQKIKSACIVFKSIMALVSGPLDVIQENISSHANKLKNKETPIRDIEKDESFIGVLKRKGDDQQSLAECMVALLSLESSLLNLVISEDFKELIGARNARNFLHDMYSVLASDASLWSDAFFNCAFASVKGNFTILLEACTPKASASCTYTHTWQKVFFGTLDEIICQLLSSPVSFLCHPTWSTIAKNLIASLPSQMKDSVTDMSRMNVDAEVHLMAAVILILQGLLQSIFFLPRWMVNCLAQLDSKFSSQTDKTFENPSVLILMKAAERVLCVPDIWEEHCHMDFTNEGLNTMQMASVRLLKLFKHRYSKPTNPAEESAFQLSNNFIKELAECCKLMPKTEFKHSESQLLQECRFEVASLKDDQESAYKSLKRVKNTLTERYEWLEDEFAKRCKSFLKNNSSTSASEDWDWSGLCKAAFKSLEWRAVRNITYHRWEMKTGAALTDAQIEVVRKIVQAFNETDCRSNSDG